MKVTCQVVSLLAAVAVVAIAKAGDDWNVCAVRKSSRSVNACTRLISEGRLDIKSLATIYVFRGIARRNQYQYDIAITDFTSAIDLLENNASSDIVSSAYVVRGDTYLQKSSYEKALADYRNALALDAKNLEATEGARKAETGIALARAVAYLLKRKVREARDEYRKVIALDPKNREAEEGVRRLDASIPAQKGWIGVQLQPMTEDVATRLEIFPPRGAVIVGLEAKGPAEKAGIGLGDVILEINGRDIATAKDVVSIMAGTKEGEPVEVVVLRQGEKVRRKVTAGTRDDTNKLNFVALGSMGLGVEVPLKRKAGFALSAMSDDLRRQYRINDALVGVVITEVAPGSHAAEKMLSAGDVIVEVGYERIESVTAYEKRMYSLRKDGRRSALLLVADPAGKARFVALRLD